MILVGGYIRRSGACFTVSDRKKTCKLTRMSSASASSPIGSVMSALCLTAAKRSAVIHVISTDPAVGAGFTACGRRIGDDWQGEYTEAPTGPVTCKGKCGDVAAARQVELESLAVLRVGQTVGIYTGFQSVTGKWVGSYGRITAIVEGWNGKPSYSVREIGATESFIYHRWMLASATDLDEEDAKRTERNRRTDFPTVYGTEAERITAGLCVDCGGSQRWDDGSICATCRTPRKVSTVGAYVPRNPARAASMAAHPAGKGRRGQAYADPITGDAVYRVANVKPVPTSVASVLALLDSSPWDARPVAPLNTYTPRITYRHQG